MHDDGPRLIPALERATFRAEAPVRKVVRSHRLNPLPHAGTISVFLLIVVVVTGVYITLFFGFGFEASHRSVEKMHDHPIQSTVRTVHRYASAGLVLTTLVHAWRIFVAGRFRGPRRWRWATGVAMLLIVWLAGVTGYWLVWDERAQAINEVIVTLFGDVGWIASYYVANVASPDAGSGWGVLFAIWTAHLLLTAVIGYFLWRHLRRSHLSVMPPRRWMAIMLGALVAVSIAFPAELLDRASPTRLVGDLPLDPFVMFLLPLLLSDWAWAAAIALIAVALAVAFAPWRSTPPPVVTIDDDACTGCELCVLDCPYEALTMQSRVDADDDLGTQARRPLAVLDPAACVGCGICIGSCSFGAIELPGLTTTEPVDPAGRHVVISCQRHLDAADTDSIGDDVALVEVACSGMIHANVVGSLMRAGATDVQIVGCAPGDCAFGLGNTILDERLRAGRAPHVPGAFAGVAREDWVAPGELIDAIAQPNRHPDADADSRVPARRLVGAVVVVVVSIAAVALATRAPYGGDDDRAALRVVVDHTPGLQLEGQPAPTGAPGDEVEIVALRSGEPIGRATMPQSGSTAAGLFDVDLGTGTVDLEVLLLEGDDRTSIYRGSIDLDAGERFVVNAMDVPPPAGIAEGKRVFEERGLGSCDVCHSTRPGDRGVGPSLAGVADRAATRVPGLAAEDYLRQSILDPDAYVVDGYRDGQMLDVYEQRLSPEQIDSLVAYLLSLTGDGS